MVRDMLFVCSGVQKPEIRGIRGIYNILVFICEIKRKPANCDKKVSFLDMLLLDFPALYMGPM